MKIHDNGGQHRPLPPTAEQPAQASKRGAGKPQPVPSVTLTLSDEARTGKGHGKNPNSPAHQARELIATYEELGRLPFGQVVSTLARGEDPVSRFVGGTEPPVTDPVAGAPADEAVEETDNPIVEEDTEESTTPAPAGTGVEENSETVIGDPSPTLPATDETAEAPGLEEPPTGVAEGTVPAPQANDQSLVEELVGQLEEEEVPAEAV